jgi:hypothetical protein
MPARYQRCTGHFPQVRPTAAKPSGDHIAPGGFCLSAEPMRRDDMRRYWMSANYLIAITLAMIGWLWLIAWIARQLT